MIPFDWLDIFATAVSDSLNTDLIAVRLLLSILFGYPIAIMYSLFSGKWTIAQRQMFLLACGMFLFAWNFGLDIVHMFIGIFITMLVNYLFFRSKASVIFAFVFNMSYLLSGSYIYNRGTYDINWTTPYCILCLRLIGLTWDLFDASQPESVLSAYQKQSALSTFPGVLETLSFCFVPTAFLSGPQFPMRHYQAFVDGTLRPTAILESRSLWRRTVGNVKVQRTVIRFFMGLLGIIVLSKALPRFPADFMLSTEFQEQWGLFWRLAYMVLFAQLTLFRYVTIWLIGEGACVMLGLGCTGLVHIRQPNGNGQCASKPRTTTDSTELRTKSALDRRDSAIAWSELSQKLDSYDPNTLDLREADHTACANISLGNLLLATNSDHMVAGFNINTNKWMLEYVYKRLRFLGNKQLSQIITLVFLAFWHGTYTGYFVNFALEFVIIAAERDFLIIVKRSNLGEFLFKTTLGRIVATIVGKLHVLFMLATPLTAFYLLQFRLWFPVFRSTYFIGFVYFLWPLLRPLVKRVLPPRKMDSKSNGVLPPSANTVSKTKKQ